MKRFDIYLAGVLVVICVWFIRTCEKQPIVDMKPLEQRIESLRNAINNRDTLIVHRDTVIRQTNRIKELTREYITHIDTVLKLQICDTLAVACDSLADRYRTQDSVFRAQIFDYRQLISKQDSSIELLKKQSTRRFIAGFGVGFATGLIVPRTR
jgi:hypothetical protein